MLVYKQIPKDQGVCCKEIKFNINTNTHAVTDIEFSGGCNGNLKSISRLCNGMKAEDIISKISDVTCGNKSTSCSKVFCDMLNESIGDINRLCNHLPR